MAIVTSNPLVDTFLLLGIFFYTLYKYITWDFDYWSKRNVSYVKPTPFLGNFGSVVATRKSIGKCLYDLYFQMAGKDYFGMWVFGTPHFVVQSPELIKDIFVRDFQYFNDRTVASDKEADPIMAHVIFIMKNPMWKSMRARLTPVFTTGRMKQMLGHVIEAGQSMNTYLTRMTSDSSDKQVVEVGELAARFTTDVITSCIFGVHAKSFENEDAEFRAIGRRMFGVNIGNAIRGFLYFLFPAAVSFFKVRFFQPGVNEFCRDAFWQTIEERKRTGMKRNDLIDIIIEMQQTEEFEGDEAVAQAMQFFVAGFDTTASTISFALYECAMNEHIQTALRAEIKELTESGEDLTYDGIKSLKYLDMVVKETLRKYPILPFLDRRCVQDYMLPNKELRIEKGTPVYVSTLALHNDPQYFPNPEVFDPERFSDDNINKIVPYSYLPFGIGPRNCIGERFGIMTSKVGIVQIVANFFLKCNTKTPSQPMDFDPRNFLLHSIAGIPLTFVPVDPKF